MPVARRLRAPRLAGRRGSGECGTTPGEAGGLSCGAQDSRGGVQQQHWRPRSSLGLGTAGVSAAPPAGVLRRPGEETEEEEEPAGEAEPRCRRKWRRRVVLYWGELDRTSVRTVASYPRSRASVPRPQTLRVPVSGRARTGASDPALRGMIGGQGENRWSQRAFVHWSTKGAPMFPSPAGDSRATYVLKEESFIRFSCFCYLKPSRLSETKLRN